MAGNEAPALRKLPGTATPTAYRHRASRRLYSRPDCGGRPGGLAGISTASHGSRHARAAGAHQRADGRHRPPPRGRATRRANVRDDHKTRYEFGYPLEDTHLAGEARKSRRTPTRRRSKRLAATIESGEAPETVR